MEIQTASRFASFVGRANGNLVSQQPRFNKLNPNSFYTSLLRFTNSDIQNEPKYGTSQRDEWLRKVWKQEPYLAGVINSVTSIDKNRGWTITGGRNQVKRFVNLLHNRFFFAPDLSGWRMSFGGSALSYYTSDLGSVTEIGRDGENGPLDSLYFVDPARCQLTGNFETPLKYNPAQGSEQLWQYNDYFRIVSLPDTDEARYGLGFCALSRAIELTKIMIGIYQYDNEMLLNRAPRGLLLLKGITEQQWEQAMTARDAKLDGDEKQYYGAVNVLAQNDPGVELEAQLVALSSLPAEFNQQVFTDLLMYGYALVFGYDPREFWPVSAGSLGTATETEAQHRKAGAKGGLDFVLGYAEQLQEELPDTVQFEFEERDLDGELANAMVQQAQAEVVTMMYESGLREGYGMFTPEQGRMMFADRQLIDPEWTMEQEEAVATDTDDEVVRALSNERVQRAIWQYPNEPIVQYRFKVESGREVHDYQTILNPVQMSKMRKFYSYSQRMKRRQGDIDTELEDYQDNINRLAQEANDGEISQEEFEYQLEALTIAILTLAMVRGADIGGDVQTSLEDAALLTLEDPTAIDTALAVLTDAELLASAYPPDALNVLGENIDGSLQSTLSQDIYSGQYTDNAQGLLSRLGMWGITAAGVYGYGQLVGNPTQEFIWNLGPTEKHCDSCAGASGQVRTGQEWRDSGIYPKSPALQCGGHRCLCVLSPV